MFKDIKYFFIHSVIIPCSRAPAKGWDSCFNNLKEIIQVSRTQTLGQLEQVLLVNFIYAVQYIQ